MKHSHNKFQCALKGLCKGLKDKSIATQFMLGLLAIGAGAFLQLTRIEWMIVLLCIGLVIGMEIMNTAIERLADLYKDSYDERIGYIKDLSAGGVLFASIIAFVCAILILRSHL